MVHSTGNSHSAIAKKGFTITKEEKEFAMTKRNFRRDVNGDKKGAALSIFKGNGIIIIQRNIKYPRIEFKTGSLNLILPVGMNAHDVIKRHHRWITNKKEQINKYLKQSKNVKIINRSDTKFHKLVEDTVHSYLRELRGKINRIFYRKMNTKWASCSARRNITINTLMRYLPKEQIEYIIYHELTHLREKRHSTRFWTFIKKRFKDHNGMEGILFSYWFLLMKKDIVINLK